MGFMTTVFGGPSQQQEQLAGQAQQLSGTANNGFATELQNSLGTQNAISSQLNPIFQGGVNQQGESAQELAAQNTAAINNAGAASRNAEQAVGAQLAGQGGGAGSGQISGVGQQIRGSIASAGKINWQAHRTRSCNTTTTSVVKTSGRLHPAKTL